MYQSQQQVFESMPTIIIWSYDPKQETCYILRMNNLYGYGTYKFLPRRGFKWIDPKEFNLINTATIV